MTDITHTTEEPLDDARHDADPVMDVGLAPEGYRLPADTRLGRVSLQIADLGRSLEYYQTVLGLRVLERSESSALLGTVEGSTALVELHERKGATAVPHHGRLGLYHFAILLPDRASLGRFVAHLGEVGERIGASDHLVSEALYLRDPDGLGIEVYRDRPRAEWRAQNRQVEMATEPLDLAGVARAGNGVRWVGMPAGTVMGHVHLHVGNLEQGAAFYHMGIGFDKMVWTYQGALFLAAGGYHHHLGINTWAGPRAPRATAGDARLLSWRIILSSQADVTATAASMKAAGFVVENDAGSIVADDPWGTTVRIGR
ncbi:MAG: Glyoxalase/bleomycin resistance protein/dioxygenase [Gemmatimonadetes bacterium]|nr:Glyoxalase/bleomycin resistance protein/dioxygenase [Gemmatimonadota bacterium]